MNKVKFRYVSIIALAVLFLLSLGAAVFASLPVRASADSYAPTTVFSAGTGQVSASAAEEGGDSFILFTFSKNGDTVYYRRDLALKWYAAPEEDGGKSGKVNYFSAEFSFPEVNFKTFTLTFESAQENIDKEGTTTNAVVFTAGDGGELTAAVRNGKEGELSEAVSLGAVKNVSLAFANDANGDFDVVCNGTAVGKVTNIGGNFMEYLSSASSTPRIPITFSAELKEAAEGETQKKQEVLVKSLNGQSFKLTDGKVTDDTAPVLVVNEEVVSFPLGQKFSLSYEAIDVCKDTVSVTREYYMYQEAKEGEESKKDYSTLTTSTYFMPTADANEAEYVSIRFKLDDGRTKDGTEDDDYVYLAWYAKETVEKDGTDYVTVSRDDEQGPAYSCIVNDETGETKTSELDRDNEAYKAYQEAVAQASENLNAGEGAYFYLPSLRGLISDDNTDYRNLKFSIYYKRQSSSTASSQTSLSYNALKFEIADRGEYTFRVVATDKLGNAMKYYLDGELVEVTSSNVWDIDAIPQFTFQAGSAGATVEDPGEQAIGYRDSVYSVDSFEIVAMKGYQTEHTLYKFNQTKYIEETKKTSIPSYSEMVKNPELYEEYLDLIREYDSSVSEDDKDAWSRTDNDYEWKPSSLTFRPVESGFYFVKVEVTDAAYWKDTVSKYQVIQVINPIDETQGETYWVQNNIISIVLFSVSAVLLIALIVMWTVKPSEEKVDEVDLKKLKGGKNNKK